MTDATKEPTEPIIPAKPPLQANFMVTGVTKTSDGKTSVVLSQQAAGTIGKDARLSEEDANAPTGTITVNVSGDAEPRFQLNQKYTVVFAAKDAR